MSSTVTTTVECRKKREKKVEPEAYSELSLRTNMSIFEYTRSSMSALSGATAGILGLTSLYGFVFYFITAFMLSIMLLVKMGKDWPEYVTSRFSVITNGLLNGLFTYILFWTFLFGMVHVY